MLEHLLSNLTSGSALTMNSDIICMINDREEMLDKYTVITMNCDILIASPAVNAKLLEKGATINTDNTIITDYQGEFLRISGGELGDGADYAGTYVIVTGDLILRDGGVRAFENTVGAAISGTLYYPDNCGMNTLAKIQGNKRAYPAGAHVMLGNKSLEQILTEAPVGANLIWVAGEVSVLEGDAIARAKQRGVFITCDRLFSRKGLADSLRDLVEAPEQLLAPDDHMITGPLTLSMEASLLYGDKLFIRGAALLEEKDADCLSDFQSIIVKGCASLPKSCAKAFNAVGKADSYRLYEGKLHNINGFELISHERLHGMVERGKKMTMHINGFALFAEDVTAGDMDAFAELSCNGFIVMPGEAQGAMTGRMGSINGFTADPVMLQQMSGLSMEELLPKLLAAQSSGSVINTDVYIMA